MSEDCLSSLTFKGSLDSSEFEKWCNSLFENPRFIAIETGRNAGKVHFFNNVVARISKKKKRIPRKKKKQLKKRKERNKPFLTVMTPTGIKRVKKIIKRGRSISLLLEPLNPKPIKV